jgi:ribose transport system substrate-binding protein
MASTAAILKEATTKRKLELPSTAPPLEKVKGKSVWFIAAGLQFEVVANIAKGFEQAATTAGLVPVVYDGRANVSGWNAGVEAAVAQKAGAIILHGVDPKLVSGPLEEAQKAGIPVIDSTNGSNRAPLLLGLKAHVSFDYSQHGIWAANYALHESGCQGSIGLVYTPVFTAQVEIRDAAQKVIAEKCPSCRFVVQEIAAPKVATEGGQIVLSMVRRNPNMKVIITTADLYARVFVPPLEAEHSSVKLVGWEGHPTNLGYIKERKIQTAGTVWPPAQLYGWLQVDQVARLMAGEPPVEIVGPIHFTTSDTITTVEAEHALNQDFPERFKKYWGR